MEWGCYSTHTPIVSKLTPSSVSTVALRKQLVLLTLKEGEPQKPLAVLACKVARAEFYSLPNWGGRKELQTALLSCVHSPSQLTSRINTAWPRWHRGQGFTMCCSHISQVLEHLTSITLSFIKPAPVSGKNEETIRAVCSAISKSRGRAEKQIQKS